ncbi:MAG: hypothetical protein KDI62_26240 [Anaerolineae bacterium]|nr:hypothetical protein [Anaerolineae bacterium]
MPEKPAKTNAEKIEELEQKLLYMEETLKQVEENTTVYTIAAAGARAIGDHLYKTKVSNAARRQLTADLVAAYRREIADLRKRVEELERR